MWPPGFRMKQGRGTPCAIATRPSLRPIRVEKADRNIRARIIRRVMKRNDLVATNAGAPISQRRDPGRREAKRLPPLIKNDEIVAAAVHLSEPGEHGTEVIPARPGRG
jgi:hypothetical protein